MPETKFQSSFHRNPQHSLIDYLIEKHTPQNVFLTYDYNLFSSFSSINIYKIVLHVILLVHKILK